MGRRLKVAEQPDPDAPLTRRLRMICDLLWRGNQSKMGKECGGIGQSVISRVLSGVQAPPAKLLEELAKQPGINVRWLLLGEGEPLSDRGLGWGGGNFCPVARELLPGPPQVHAELLSGATWPVASAYYSSDAYWLPIPEGHPLTAVKGGAVQDADLILIETAEAWTRKVQAIQGRVVAFRMPMHASPVLGAVDKHEDYFAGEEKTHEVTLFGTNIEVEFFAGLRRPAQSEQVLARQWKRPGKKSLYLDDVVGVCLHLFRPLDSAPFVAPSLFTGSSSRGREK